MSTGSLSNRKDSLDSAVNSVGKRSGKQVESANTATANDTSKNGNGNTSARGKRRVSSAASNKRVKLELEPEQPTRTSRRISSRRASSSSQNTTAPSSSRRPNPAMPSDEYANGTDGEAETSEIEVKREPGSNRETANIPNPYLIFCPKHSTHGDSIRPSTWYFVNLVKNSGTNLRRSATRPPFRD